MVHSVDLSSSVPHSPTMPSSALPQLPLPSTSSPPSHSRSSVVRLHQRSASDTTQACPPATSRRTPPFPFSFLLPFRPNPSSSVVPSTAEGKAIPVDGSTVEYRTSALRELNNSYPSRHRYERSTGAENTTYSEPVIVRSYYSPLPHRPIRASRGGVMVHGGAGTVSQSGSSATAERRSLPFTTNVTTNRDDVLGRMVRTPAKRRFSAAAGLAETGLAEAKLPPVEAFSFRSFMANMEAQDAGNSDINADLDRIAEICARSRYSLSNQYEVHYAPHGSGSTFLEVARGQDPQGPTLQAVTSDDERRMRRQRRRPVGPRRNSRAMGTLETIMSSSRSSEEDKSKKRPAAEIADEVRGRAARKDSRDASPTTSSQCVSDDHASQSEQPSVHLSPGQTSPGRRTASLALIDGHKQNHPSGDPSSPRNSTTSLVGEPAQPQASNSHLEIRTAPEEPTKESNRQIMTSRHPQLASHEPTVARGAVASTDPGTASESLLSTLGRWIPWQSTDGTGRRSGRAEGSLRELLRTADAKVRDAEETLPQ